MGVLKDAFSDHQGDFKIGSSKHDVSTGMQNMLPFRPRKFIWSYTAYSIEMNLPKKFKKRHLGQCRVTSYSTYIYQIWWYLISSFIEQKFTSTPKLEKSSIKLYDLEVSLIISFSGIILVTHYNLDRCLLCWVFKCFCQISGIGHQIEYKETKTNTWMRLIFHTIQSSDLENLFYHWPNQFDLDFS